MKITQKEFNIIGKIAKSFHKTTGLDYDDLYSEGLLAYCLCAHKYEKKYGAKNTFLYHVINNHLKNYIDKNYTRQIHTVSFSVLKNFDFPDGYNLKRAKLTPLPNEFIYHAY